MQALLAWGLRMWRGAEVEEWTRHTLADQLAKIDNPAVRAVLGAPWGGLRRAASVGPVCRTCSGDRLVQRECLLPGRRTSALRPDLGVGDRSGWWRTAFGVQRHAHCVERRPRLRCRVRTSGEREGEQARHVISAMGVSNTVACLDPTAAEGWQQTIGGFRPGLSYVSLFLGLDGDIAAAGASSANHWIYETEDIGLVWRDRANSDAPGIFVSFPTLKDPSSHAKPTAEVIAVVDANAFAPWFALADNEPPEEYLALKSWVEERLLAQFLCHFSALRPILRFHELSTPVTQRRYVRSPDGAMHGMEMSAERLTSPALHVRTPLPGLFLAGQDVTNPGAQGAFMGGLLAAASAEPTLWASLRS